MLIASVVFCLLHCPEYDHVFNTKFASLNLEKKKDYKGWHIFNFRGNLCIYEKNTRINTIIKILR